MQEQIRNLIRASPFRPFTIFMSDGRSFGVPTSDHASIMASGLIVVEDDKGAVNLLPPSQLAGIETRAAA
jgi:hypothetical protein